MEDCAVINYGLRHGKSIQNAGDFFDGGGHDDGPDGPVVLIPVGELQAEAASYGAQALDLPITQVYHSVLKRAEQTATIFVDKHPRLSGVLPLLGVHEIDHGSLQRDESRILKGQEVPYRAVCNDAMVHALGKCGLSSEQLSQIKKYVDWITPLGRGDGESYLEAGMRGCNAMEAIRDQNGALIAWHKGIGRQTRALATVLTLEQRMELSGRYTEQVAEIAAANRQEVAALKISGKASDVEKLSDQFNSLAHALAPIALQLDNWNIPMMRDLRGVENGAIAEVGIREDGRWVRGRLIESSIHGLTRPVRSSMVTTQIVHSSWT